MEYHLFSGYWLNKSKTEILALNAEQYIKDLIFRNIGIKFSNALLNIEGSGYPITIRIT